MVEVSHLISTQQSSFSVTEDKTEGRKTLKQAAAEGGCSEDLAEHLQGGNSVLGDVHELQTSGVTDCKGFSSNS